MIGKIYRVDLFDEMIVEDQMAISLDIAFTTPAHLSSAVQIGSVLHIRALGKFFKVGKRIRYARVKDIS